MSQRVSKRDKKNLKRFLYQLSSNHRQISVPFNKNNSEGDMIEG